ncbi:MAG: FixH family protein [Bacteroidota bacterium]
MNWGKGIALSFILFAGFIMFMVVKCFQQDFHLVTEEYYREEVNYQQRIEERNNLKRLDEELQITSGNGFVKIDFPTAKAEGKIAFYRPNNSVLDKNYEIKLAEGNSYQNIDKAELLQGRYRVKVSWTDGTDDFFGEKLIYIQ